MPGKLIDGKAIAEQINAETVAEIGRLKERHGLTPGSPLSLSVKIQPVPPTSR